MEEVKRHLDGREERFPVEPLLVRPGLAVVAFRMPLAVERGGFRFAAGSVTYGFFWVRRPYNLYRFTGPDGGVLGYRFDAVADVRLGPERVEYRDLVLDVVLRPGVPPVVEDEEELGALQRAGRVRPAEVAAARRARDTVLRRHRRVIREAEGLLATLIGGGSSASC